MFGLGVEFYITLFFIVYILLVVEYKRYVDYDIFLLISFLLSYLFVDLGSQLEGGVVDKMRFVLLSLGSYFVGQDIQIDRCCDQLKSVFAVLLFSLGLGIKGVFGFFYTIQSHPEALLNRQYYDFFQRSETPMHGLGLSSFLVVSMALIPVLIYGLLRYRYIFSLLEKAIILLVLVVGASGVYISNLLQNRTPFAVLIAAVFVPFISISRNEKSRYAGYLFLLLVIIASMYAYYADTLRLFDAGVLSRPIEEVRTLTGRTDHWSNGLTHMMYYPLGHAYLVDGRNYWFHNFWLDIYRVSGFVPLTAIVMFQFRHFDFKFRKFIQGSQFEGGILLTCLIALFLVFMTTPIPEGTTQVYYFSLVILGYIKGVHFGKKYIEDGDIAEECF
jgi:hypothetical protein